MGRRVHSPEFKREAAKLALQPGKSKVQVARELGVHINVLRHWIRQFEAGKWEATPSRILDVAHRASQRGFLRDRVEAVVVLAGDSAVRRIDHLRHPVGRVVGVSDGALVNRVRGRRGAEAAGPIPATIRGRNSVQVKLQLSDEASS